MKTKKASEIKDWCEVEYGYTSKNVKSDKVGMIKIKIKVLDLVVPMGKASDITRGLAKVINSVLTRCHDKSRLK